MLFLLYYSTNCERGGNRLDRLKAPRASKTIHLITLNQKLQTDFYQNLIPERINEPKSPKCCNSGATTTYHAETPSVFPFCFYCTDRRRKLFIFLFLLSFFKCTSCSEWLFSALFGLFSVSAFCSLAVTWIFLLWDGFRIKQSTDVKCHKHQLHIKRFNDGCGGHRWWVPLRSWLTLFSQTIQGALVPTGVC